MNPCKCSGNNSLKSGIGGFRCDCGGSIELPQVLARIVSRLDELDDMNSSHIQGFGAADLWQCSRCGKWHKELDVMNAGDRTVCERCWGVEFFVREDDDSETIGHVLPLLMASAISGKVNKYYGKPYLKLFPHDRNGVLVEPFLSEYLR